MDYVTDLQAKMALLDRQDEDEISRRENRAICERLDRIGWTLRNPNENINHTEKD